MKSANSTLAAGPDGHPNPHPNGPGNYTSFADATREHRPGGQQLIEQIKSAAYVTAEDGTPLVERVTLIAPLGDVNGAPMTPATPEAAYRAPYCTEIVVRVEGIDD